MFVAKMKTLLFVLVIVELGVSAPEKSRAIGGHDADILDYPYQVVVAETYGEQRLVASGTIISETFVLTEAYGVFLYEPSHLLIRANTSKSSSGSASVLVKNITMYPGFFENDLYDDLDIAVIELETPLEFGPGVQPIRLPEASEEIEVGSEVTFTGWGSTDGGRNISEQLQSIVFRIISNEDCAKQQTEFNVTENMLCTASGDGNSPCWGDEGNPLVSNGTLRAIYLTSYLGAGEKPCTTEPGIYTNVVKMLDFILDVTGDFKSRL